METTGQAAAPYTPGPWKVDKGASGFYVYPYDDGEVGPNIARVHREADARLIAETPALIAALRELLIDFDAFDKGGAGSKLAAYRNARALVAKIDGREG